MVVMRIDQPLEWSSEWPGLDGVRGPQPPLQTLQELCHDWHGKALQVPAQFGLVEDPGHLWLVAARDQAAAPHPKAGAGDFQAGLWRHDVAELFVAEASGERYLEFNLSPTGAWWLEHFRAPRQASPLEVLPQVLTHGSPPGRPAWSAALGIPLDWLREIIGWDADSRLNVCLILDSPGQHFLSACDLGEGEPDFHRPWNFEKVLREA
ncbi:MAG: hypothetical protein R3242_05155 [Akkermansiaceae bacterium]|nr:hypothetical protein [Akkermansiaceae bacterium]